MNPPPSAPLRIAIIGAGSAGTLVAIQLLRQTRRPLLIQLIERGTEIGGGVAYSASHVAHKTNQPAARLGAWSEDPGHFARWLAARDTNFGGAGDFPPRSVVGEYLRDVLASARAQAAGSAELLTLRAEIDDLEPSGDSVRVLCRDGRVIETDRVVLAVGNLPGEYPIPRPLPVYRDPRYVHVPWLGNPLAGLSPDEDVLLVGQGAIAVDLMVQLEASGHRGTIHALSRQGVRPKVHRVAPEVPFPFVPEEFRTVRRAVRRLRTELEAAARRGADWRTVIDGLRPFSQRIWQAWTWDERARFLRHARALWEAHRHRFAPGTLEHIERRVAAGKLKFYAGRLQVLERDAAGITALFRRRGTIQHVELRVARVINCTDSRTDYSKYQHPLFIHLLARGLIDHDPLALGINALPTGEVLRYRGAPLGWLYTLGTPLKGVLWETVGLEEIRGQAAVIAERIVSGRPGPG